MTCHTKVPLVRHLKLLENSEVEELTDSLVVVYQASTEYDNQEGEVCFVIVPALSRT